MGLNGLFSFCKKYIEKKKTATAVKGRKIGVDIFWFIHKSKGDVNKIRVLLNDFIENCAMALLVFDGKVSEDRKPELAFLKQKRGEMKQTIKELEKKLEENQGELSDTQTRHLTDCIADLRIKSWAPHGNYIGIVKEAIRGWWGVERCKIITAPYEADLYFGELEAKGEIDSIVSNDSDMLALGYKYLIRPNEDEVDFVMIYRIERILGELRMSVDDWKQFMELCRKYLKTHGKSENYDILVPYSQWRVYMRR